MKDTIIGYSNNDFYYTNASDISEINGILNYNNASYSGAPISCNQSTMTINDTICKGVKSTDQNAGEKIVNCYVREVCRNKEKSSQLKTFLPENISVSNEKYKNSKSEYNIEYLKRMNYIIGIISSITISIYYITKK
jgi:hypothetical protein